MFLSTGRTLLVLSVCALFAADSVANDEATGIGQSVRRILSQFDTGNPGWKVRMRSLVQLAKVGPMAVPTLLDGLKTGAPTTREFAAQALGMFAEPSARAALEQALKDPKPTVRIYAIRALCNLGPLSATEKYEKMTADPDRNVRATIRSALQRAEKFDAGALRKAWAGYDLSKLDTLRVGEMAPDFELTSFSGKTHRLSDYRGKKEVVIRYIKLDY